jgi:pre-mRNA-splicing helicase BRR2
MLVCAPTSAGKTNVALMAILQVVGEYIRDDQSIDLRAFKIVYIAPMKALVA